MVASSPTLIVTSLSVDLITPRLDIPGDLRRKTKAAIFANFGAVKSVTFKSVDQNGADIYTVDFDHGSTEWHIIMSPDGKIESLNFRPN
jgi:hypothetical protein